jgi:hypothetical protein
MEEEASIVFKKHFVPSWVAQMNKIEISKDQIGMNVMC